MYDVFEVGSWGRVGAWQSLGNDVDVAQAAPGGHATLKPHLNLVIYTDGVKKRIRFVVFNYYSYKLITLVINCRRLLDIRLTIQADTQLPSSPLSNNKTIKQ